jgi:hypothetical protein
VTPQVCAHCLINVLQVARLDANDREAVITIDAILELNTPVVGWLSYFAEQTRV